MAIHSSENLADYIGGVVVSAVVWAKSCQAFSIADPDSQRAILWCITRQARRFEVVFFAIVVLPQKVRLVVNGSLDGVAKFLEALSGAIIDVMRRLHGRGSMTYSYCVTHSFRLYTMSELDREFVGCAVSPVTLGQNPYIESYGLYNSIADALHGESPALTRATGEMPVVRKLRLVDKDDQFRVQFRRLPHCGHLANEVYSERIETLIKKELELHRKACELMLGKMNARQKLRAALP